MILARPQAEELSSPFHANYIACVVGDVDPVAALESQRDQFLAQLALSESRAQHRYEPGKWSVKQVVGHLADAERIFAYRLLRIGRNDPTPLPGFEEDDYVAAGGFDDRAFSDLVGEWSSARAATIALVRGLPAAAWEQRGTVNDGQMTARALLYLILGHTEHHRAVLDQRYGVSAAPR
jgi:uncharacterized damage-inducible protein DinB